MIEHRRLELPGGDALPGREIGQHGLPDRVERRVAAQVAVAAMDRGDQAEEDLHVLLNLLRERTALARKGGGMVAVCQRVHPVAGRSALISRWIARHRLQRRMARIGLGDDPVQVTGCAAGAQPASSSARRRYRRIAILLTDSVAKSRIGVKGLGRTL